MDDDREKPWAPLQGHTVRAERLDETGGYLIRWAHGDDRVMWVDWAVYVVAGTVQPGGARLYELPDARTSESTTEDIDAAAPLIEGFTKWDGCTQWSQPHAGHVDSRRSFEALWRAVETARRVSAVEFMADEYDINSEYRP